jgi:hypothetical protein
MDIADGLSFGKRHGNHVHMIARGTVPIVGMTRNFYHASAKVKFLLEFHEGCAGFGGASGA